MGSGNETEGGTVKNDDVLEVNGHLGIYLSGYDGLAHKVETVTIADVRRWLNACEKFGLSDETELEDCALSIYIDAAEVVPIEDAEIAGEPHMDALIVLPRKEVK